MPENIIVLSPAIEGIRLGYQKIAYGFVAGAAVTAGLYVASQATDSINFWALAITAGIVTAALTPSAILSHRANSKKRTAVDIINKTITVTYGDKVKEIPYDAILSAEVETPGLLERRVNIGSVQMEVLSVKKKSDGSWSEDADLETRTFTFPMQSEPLVVRDNISKGSITYEQLKRAVRTAL